MALCLLKKTFPLLFASMKSKLKNAYLKIFTFMKINIALVTKIYIGDLESATIEALKKIFACI